MTPTTQHLYFDNVRGTLHNNQSWPHPRALYLIQLLPIHPVTTVAASPYEERGRRMGLAVRAWRELGVGAEGVRGSVRGRKGERGRSWGKAVGVMMHRLHYLCDLHGGASISCADDARPRDRQRCQRRDLIHIAIRIARYLAAHSSHPLKEAKQRLPSEAAWGLTGTAVY